MALFEINVHYPPEELKMMIQSLEDIRREVAECKTAQQSAVSLIQSMVTKINDLSQQATELGDLKAGLAELTQGLSDSTDTLANAVAANTPDANVPSEPGPVDPGYSTPPTNDADVSAPAPDSMQNDLPPSNPDFTNQGEGNDA